MAVIVGDSLARDIGGARHAGLKGIWLNRAGEAGDAAIVPDAHIASLPELWTVLQSWDDAASRRGERRASQRRRAVSLARR
jgi:ribonucleotide monophosphatase NagD (HAD superfamily)